MAKRGPEKLFEDALRQELEALGAIVVKLHGNMFQRDLPDCMVLHAGKVIFFETKADAATATEMLSSVLWAKLRPAQLYTAKKWKAKRVLVWVVAGSAKEKCGYAARAVVNASEVHRKKVANVGVDYGAGETETIFLLE